MTNIYQEISKVSCQKQDWIKIPESEAHCQMSVYRGCQAPASPGPQVTLVTAGPAEVGKTSLISRFCNDTFNEVTHYYKFDMFTFLVNSSSYSIIALNCYQTLSKHLHICKALEFLVFLNNLEKSPFP